MQYRTETEKKSISSRQVYFGVNVIKKQAEMYANHLSKENPNAEYLLIGPEDQEEILVEPSKATKR